MIVYMSGRSQGVVPLASFASALAFEDEKSGVARHVNQSVPRGEGQNKRVHDTAVLENGHGAILRPSRPLSPMSARSVACRVKCLHEVAALW